MTDALDQDGIDLEVDMLATLAEGTRLHRLPTLVLSARMTTLTDKFSTTMFGILLEAGSACEGLAEWVSSMPVITTDFGVEFGLNLVPPVAIRTL